MPQSLKVLNGRMLLAFAVSVLLQIYVKFDAVHAVSSTTVTTSDLIYCEDKSSNDPLQKAACSCPCESALTIVSQNFKGAQQCADGTNWKDTAGCPGHGVEQ